MSELLKDSYKNTTLGWQRANLKIVDKQSQLVGLKHNIAQLKVNNAMQLQIQQNLPVLVVILKARQEGISTFLEGRIFENINRHPNRHGCVASADEDATKKVFRMCQTYQEEMPKDIQRPTDKSNTKEIIYSAPHRSSMLCQTAGKKILGRGGTTQDVHATEVAFWANARTQLLGLLQEVPDKPGTMIALESTANGVGGAFYEEYWGAVDRLRVDPYDYSGYLPIFLSWQDFPEYAKTLPKELKGNVRLLPDVSDYFLSLQAKGLSFSPEQMYWASLVVQNKCGGDIDLFKQEYPSSAREAFQSTGRMVFKPLPIDRMEKECCDPVDHVEFYMDENTNKVKYRHVNRRANCWAVWKWPTKGHDYIVFGDVAEGVLSDTNDPKSDPDRSVGIVLDRKQFDVPMVYYGRPSTIEFGDQLLMAAKFWDYAWASPEVNSIGQSLLDTFKRDGYQYLYQREHREETEVTEDSKNLGWKTTTKTRKPMIADLVKVIDEGELRVFDIRIIGELRVFITNPQGKPEAEKGEHDDCVLSLAGAIQLHKRCPAGEDYSWADETKEEHKAINVMGAYDDDEDEEDEDDDDVLYEDMSEFN